MIDFLLSLSYVFSMFLMSIINSIKEFLNNNSGVISIIITIVGVYIAWKIYKKTHRPVIFIEINAERSTKDVKMGSYYLNIGNVGNVLAKKISISCSDDEINKLFKTSTPNNKDRLEHTKEVFKTSLNQTINYLSFKNDRNGYLFGHYQGNESSNIINFDVNFKVTITYYDYLTNLKYTDIIVMSIINDLALTDYYLIEDSDEITILKEIKNSINSLPSSIKFNDNSVKAYTQFVNSLNQEELFELKDIVKEDRNSFFQTDEIKKLEEIMNKTKRNRLKTKIKKYIVLLKNY